MTFFDKRIFKNMPIFLGGIFLVYVAAMDETLFNFMLGNMIQGQVPIAIANVVATTTAAAVPMFFAVGMIKQSMVSGLYTIYYYERMLEKPIFWTMIIILLVWIIITILLIGIYQFNVLTLVCSVLLVFYLLIVKVRHKRPRYR